jgi:thiamine-phosphate pyrophosphorylase
MHARHHPWPRIWLMTDECMGDRMWEVIARLPQGAGLIFRHYSLPAGAREDLATRVAEAADQQQITLAVAADVDLAKRVGAKLVHNPGRRDDDLPFSVSVHSMEEVSRSKGAALAFISPVFATSSHPGQEPLGTRPAGEIARATGVPAIALGGMDAEKFAQIEHEGFYGWAGIDAWLRT